MRGTIFPGLPYNTKRIYTRGVCKSGCEIWIPVMSDEIVKDKQEQLQNILNNQPEPVKELA